MDYQMHKSYYLLIANVFFCVTIHGVHGRAIVTGSVFCDQCNDGQLSPFVYPLSGTKIKMVCPRGDGQMMVVGENTTDMLGNYAISFNDTPHLKACYAQTAPGNNGPGPNHCGATTGPPKSIRLMHRTSDMDLYTIDPLISMPAQPMSFCPKSSSLPGPNLVSLLPPTPFLEASPCSYQYWQMPEYKCYWRVVSPEMQVVLVFGPVAAKVYGPETTLWTGLHGRGDPNWALLREAITALLNSYNSFNFPYNAFQVVNRLNSALSPPTTTRSVLVTALGFKRANSGYGHASCKFTPC